LTASDCYRTSFQQLKKKFFSDGDSKTDTRHVSQRIEPPHQPRSRVREHARATKNRTNYTTKSAKAYDADNRQSRWRVQFGNYQPEGGCEETSEAEGQCGVWYRAENISTIHTTKKIPG
jgi:hypothetical protein